jgi:hypothetical protein
VSLARPVSLFGRRPAWSPHAAQLRRVALALVSQAVQRGNVSPALVRQRLATGENLAQFVAIAPRESCRNVDTVILQSH